MRLLFVIQAALIALGVVVFSVDSLFDGLSFGLGGMLMLVNVIGLTFLWDSLFQKKHVALSLLVIVSKYAILGFVLFKILSLSWLHPVLFSIGIGSFGVAAVIYGLICPRPISEAQGNT
jgi:hypothetical protein